MAIRADGSLWAWGHNHFGQLGDGTTILRYIPVKVMNDVVSVSAGVNHTMAIKADGSLWAWGLNSWGLLGDGTNINRHTPVMIMEEVIAVSAGRNHTMAIRYDGSLWAWGSNERGLLGDGSTTHFEDGRIRFVNTPVKVMEEVVAVSAGAFHAMAITTDGSLWAWGSVTLDRSRDGVAMDQHLPVKIMEEVVAVSAGLGYSMAIKTDGSLWAWGSNFFGQLGDVTAIYHSSPIRIMDNVVAVSAGTLGMATAASAHTIAIKKDGSLWAWGTNDYGELGDGTTEWSSQPIRIMDNIMLPNRIPFPRFP